MIYVGSDIIPSKKKDIAYESKMKLFVWTIHEWVSLHVTFVIWVHNCIGEY